MNLTPSTPYNFLVGAFVVALLASACGSSTDDSAAPAEASATDKGWTIDATDDTVPPGTDPVEYPACRDGRRGSVYYVRKAKVGCGSDGFSLGLCGDGSTVQCQHFIR